MSVQRTNRTGVQLLLAVLVVGLAYWLFYALTEPWEAVEHERAQTRRTRERMDDLRTALIHHERRYDRFPRTLDSLVAFIRTDSALASQSDSLFGTGFVLDSLPYSPRTRKPFIYAVNDTSRVETYLLKDPDSPDQIGGLDGDPAQLNAASWE